MKLRRKSEWIRVHEYNGWIRRSAITKVRIYRISDTDWRVYVSIDGGPPELMCRAHEGSEADRYAREFLGCA